MLSQQIVSGTLPRSFAAGDIVISYEPWVWCFDWEEYEKMCAWCLTEREKLRSCSGCRVHRYCDASCQAADWKSGHKTECAMFRGISVPGKVVQDFEVPTGYYGFNVASSGYVMVLLLAKISRKLKHNERDELAGLGKKSAQEILTLFPDTSSSDLGMDPNRIQQHQWNSLFGGFSFGPDSGHQPKLVDVLKTVWCNAISITFPGTLKDRVVGAALFPQIPGRSMTPVCWDSNISMDFNGRMVVLHAAEDIPYFTGLKDLRYSEPQCNQISFSRAERRSSFEDVFRQPCSCRKCTPEYEAEMNPLKCVTPNCVERIPADDRAAQPCTQCGAVNTPRLQRYQNFVKNYEDIEKGSGNTADERKVQKKGVLLKAVDAAGILHKDAHLRFLCGWLMACRLRHKEQFAEAWSLMRELAPSIRAHYPKYHHDRARYLAHAAAFPINCCFRVGDSVKGMWTMATIIADYPLWMGCYVEALDIYTKLYGRDCAHAKDIRKTISNVEPIVAELRVIFHP